jgi:hypothetical protein
LCHKSDCEGSPECFRPYHFHLTSLTIFILPGSSFRSPAEDWPFIAENRIRGSADHIADEGIEV